MFQNITHHEYILQGEKYWCPLIIFKNKKASKGPLVPIKDVKIHFR
jgi:hypothetical protein